MTPAQRLHAGGIFFDDMMDRPQDQLLAFSGDCMKAVGQSYLPIVAQRKDQSYTEEHKAWQQLRRGRYVEFNLVRSAARLLAWCLRGLNVAARIAWGWMTLLHSGQDGAWQQLHQGLQGACLVWRS